MRHVEAEINMCAPWTLFVIRSLAVMCLSGAFLVFKCSDPNITILNQQI